MYLAALEKMWRYLHDDKSVVNEFLFVTNPYLYTSKFNDMLERNLEVLPLLKSKMKEERENSMLSFLMDGYGRAEYRILKMARINGFQDFLMNAFSELFAEKDNKKLTR